MKNLIFSIVVICSLAVAGIGGTLADFSDTEEEIGDKLQAGSLDLKVNGSDDPDILPFSISGMAADKVYHVDKKVANVGTLDGFLYIHFKGAVTTETNDKDLNGDGVIDATDMPEPEYVAQNGGRVDQQTVVGVGEALDMEKHIKVELLDNGQAVDISNFDKDGDGSVRLDELQSEQIPIGVIVNSGQEHTIGLEFTLVSVLDPNWTGDSQLQYWPTNAYQGDTITFDILFELLQTDYTPPVE